MTALRFHPRIYGDCQAHRLGTPENACALTECRHHLASEEYGHTRSKPSNTPACGRVHLRARVRHAHPDGAELHVVGDSLGVCRERIRQIEAGALAVIRRREESTIVLPPEPGPERVERAAGQSPMRDAAMRFAFYRGAR